MIVLKEILTNNNKAGILTTSYVHF
jgi:hypothetical protein